MAPRRTHLVVGITGGIATGKTTVARELEKRGAVLIDADGIGREVVDGLPDVRESIRESFGDGMFRPSGALDRGRLAALVFSNSKALDDLNRIVHPRLLAEIRSRVDEFRLKSRGGILVIDAALLVEWGAEAWVDYLVVVESGAEAQVERVCARDGLSREEALGRVASQTDPARRAQVADEIMVNEAGPADLVRKAQDLWRRLLGLCSGEAQEFEGGRS